MHKGHMDRILGLVHRISQRLEERTWCSFSSFDITRRHWYVAEGWLKLAQCKSTGLQRPISSSPFDLTLHWLWSHWHLISHWLCRALELFKLNLHCTALKGNLFFSIWSHRYLILHWLCCALEQFKFNWHCRKALYAHAQGYLFRTTKS